jgi:hypothetical protein
MMKFAGNNLIMDAVPEKAAGGSRKASLSVLLSQFMEKTGGNMIACEWSNLIMLTATVRGMCIRGWLKRETRYNDALFIKACKGGIL